MKGALDARKTPFFAGEHAGALDASAYGALCVWHAGGEESMEVLLSPSSATTLALASPLSCLELFTLLPLWYVSESSWLAVVQFAKEAVTKSGLQPWLERTQAAIPSVFDLQGWWPLST